MSDDIRAGDVVVCVDVRTAPNGAPCLLAKGGVYKCVYFTPEENFHSLFGTDGGGVMLAGVFASSPTGMLAAKRFRKLPKADERFTREMRALRPHRETIPC